METGGFVNDPPSLDGARGRTQTTGPSSTTPAITEMELEQDDAREAKSLVKAVSRDLIPWSVTPHMISPMKSCLEMD